MAKTTCHVAPNSNGGWDVKRGEFQRASVHTEMKADAFKVGRAMSQRAENEFVIHRADANIQRSGSHRDDPWSSKGHE